jgi:GTPase SAR1 family protein
LNILLIGEKDVGKTTLIKSILNEKDENIKKKIINNLILLLFKKLFIIIINKYYK